MNEAELLFTHILDCSRVSLYQNKDKILDRDKLELIASVLKRRLNAEPLQYILGKTEFMGLDFIVNPSVLIPRPETEILVETALKYLLISKDDGSVAGSHRILDLCTGSGCIAVALAKNLASASVDASDISYEALEVARENAALNNVAVNFIQSDLFKSKLILTGSYDMIISNPPYIVADEIKGLEPEVQREPRLALDAGSDGLDFYRRIIMDAHSFLKVNGLLLFEMGFNQRPALEELFVNSKLFQIIRVIKDYNNIDRVIVGRKVEKNG